MVISLCITGISLDELVVSLAERKKAIMDAIAVVKYFCCGEVPLSDGVIWNED